MEDPHRPSSLDLVHIRAALRRMEDSIIFTMIERAQYSTNDAIYKPNNEGLTPFKLHTLTCAGSIGCYSDYFIYQTECAHSEARRYLHPTEYSFFGPLPDPMVTMCSDLCMDGWLDGCTYQIYERWRSVQRTRIRRSTLIQLLP